MIESTRLVIAISIVVWAFGGFLIYLLYPTIKHKSFIEQSPHPAYGGSYPVLRFGAIPLFEGMFQAWLVFWPLTVPIAVVFSILIVTIYRVVWFVRYHIVEPIHSFQEERIKGNPGDSHLRPSKMLED